MSIIEEYSNNNISFIQFQSYINQLNISYEQKRMLINQATGNTTPVAKPEPLRNMSMKELFPNGIPSHILRDITVKH